MKYSNEEKLSIITRYQQGERITALSNELAITRASKKKLICGRSSVQLWRSIVIKISLLMKPNLCMIFMMP